MANSMSSELNFLNLMSKLKHLDRTGWVRSGIKNPETVAAHMYRMAVMSAFVVEDPAIDLNKCIKMSIVHDMGEAIVGDITPHCGVPESEKHLMETTAIDRMTSLLNGNKGDVIRELFKEYEEGKTPEAKLVRDLDKLDMVVQAYEYEQDTSSPGSLQQFFDSTKDVFVNSHPYVKGLVAKLYEARTNNTRFGSYNNEDTTKLSNDT